MKAFPRFMCLFVILSMILSACGVDDSTSLISGGVACRSKQIAIHTIQGPTHISPLDGKEVSCVSGIVTAIRGDGFFMQGRDLDDDPRTSEGGFVKTAGIGRVHVGDEVLLPSARVREVNPAGVGANSLSVTTLFANKVDILASNHALPEPVVLGRAGRAIPNRVIENDIKGYVSNTSGLFDPEEDGMDFYESVEGMLVQINDALAISTRNAYNEVSVVADGGLNASPAPNARGALVARDGDFNPERILIDDAFVQMPAIRQGARFSSALVGVMDYDFSNYRVLLIKTPQFENPSSSSATGVTLKKSAGELSIAAYNIENLSARDGERISLLAKELVTKLREPDLIVLEEVMDNDGSLDSAVVDADETLASICRAIKDVGGSDYAYLQVSPKRNADGGATGGNIRVAMLYRRDSGLVFQMREGGQAGTGVELVEGDAGWELNFNPGRIEGSAFVNSRKPLVAQFSYGGRSLYVIGNHFNSKGEDGPLYGNQQPPERPSERQRTAQAQSVKAFVDLIVERDPLAGIVVLGDFNDFQWSSALQTLQGEELVNLYTLLPEEERYSYLYEGNAQALDHIFVSQNLLEGVKHFEVLHLNSAQLPNKRMSDHDPLIFFLDLKTR